MVFYKGMKQLLKALRGRQCLVFLDVEATQIHHEIIEIGAVKALLDEQGRIKKQFKGFKTYVKPKEKIGSFVSTLTGITESLIEKKGIRFAKAQEMLSRYVGADYPSCLFVTYGTQDAQMFINSAEANLDSSIIMARDLAHRVFDFEAFLNRYVPGKDGNPLSQSKALNLFELVEIGQAHDALTDATNLLRLYQAFLSRKDIVLREYLQLLAAYRKGPNPLRRVLEAIVKGETVDLPRLEQFAKEDLA